MKAIKNGVWLIVLLLIFVSAQAIGWGAAAPGRGLLLVAHGSSDPGWNEQVNRIGAQLRQKLPKTDAGGFTRVAIGFLESEPSISAGVKQLEQAGIAEIYAVPLFLTPSEHLLYDVPTVLGLYRDQRTVEQLRREGIALVRSPARITLGPPLTYGDLLPEVLARQVAGLSRQSAQEGIVYLCHGSELFRPLWDGLVKAVAERVARQTGIADWDYAYVQVGQSFAKAGVPVIEKVAAAKPRVLVAGIYLGLSAQDLYERGTRRDPALQDALRKRIDAGKLVFDSKALLPEGEDLLVDWVLTRAREYGASL